MAKIRTEEYGGGKLKRHYVTTRGKGGKGAGKRGAGLKGKFVEKGVKASATRARKALAELSKLIKARRKEIQEVKNAAKTAA